MIGTAESLLVALSQGGPPATPGTREWTIEMPVDDIEPNEFRARVKAGERLFLLDVREPDEVASWAFPNALNIPMSVLAARVGELPTDQPIVVACHSGVRSASVAAALVGAGWNACNLAGGALAWVSTGDPDAGPVPN